MKDRRKGIGIFLLRCTVVILCFACFTFSTLRPFLTGGFNPRLVSTWNIPAMEAVSSEIPATPTISIEQTVIFPDETMFFLKYPPSSSLLTKDAISCIYNSSQPQLELELSPSSVDYDYDNHQIVRCPLPPRGAIPSLTAHHHASLTPGPTYKWDSLAYEAVIDNRDNTTLVFVKGLNLRSAKAADPSKFKCIYGHDLTKSKFVLQADVVSVAQEIVRCKTPLSILLNNNNPIKVSVRFIGRNKKAVDSIARVKKIINNNNNNSKYKQHGMCVCTMLRNQARFLREWVTYHTRVVGVERYFIYDNNSDDGIERVVDSLDAYNVTRRLWPWVKTQEAGFAHCAMTARDSCEWVGFIDVDEFLHLPGGSTTTTLHDEARKASDDVGELRVSCHDFGPSGLKVVPERGVTVGYTCRMAAPERHKSIVRPEALNPSLINVVHHFHLKPGFRHVNLNRSSLVINHYKYQVWEVFKEKFRRRVATYVSDWQQDTNVGSKDRAPGLGTKAVEPADWSTRFCQVRDTGLRERVLDTFTHPETGLLPWEYRV